MALLLYLRPYKNNFMLYYNKGLLIQMLCYNIPLVVGLKEALKPKINLTID